MNLKTTLLSLVLVILSFCAGAQDKPVGVYLTAEDFTKEKLTDYGAYKGAQKSFGSSAKFEKSTIKAGKDNKIWGFRGEFGYYATYRFDNNRKSFYEVRSNGPIYLYTGGGVGSSSVTYNKDSSDIIGMLYAGSDIFISMGADGELLDLGKKNLEALLANDPTLLQAFQTDKSKYGNLPYMSSILKMLHYVAVYNTKHKGAKS